MQFSAVVVAFCDDEDPGRAKTLRDQILIVKQQQFLERNTFILLFRVLQDLIETSEYTFRVYAENAAGAGKPSEPLGPIVAKDPFDKPGKPGQPEVRLPQNVNVPVFATFVSRKICATVLTEKPSHPKFKNRLLLTTHKTGSLVVCCLWSSNSLIVSRRWRRWTRTARSWPGLHLGTTETPPSPTTSSRCDGWATSHGPQPTGTGVSEIRGEVQTFDHKEFFDALIDFCIDLADPLLN